MVRSEKRSSTPRRSSADTVKTLLDRSEPVVDGRFELGIGEDVGPVVFDGLPNQFADIEWIDPVIDTFPKCLDELGARSFCRRRGAKSTCEPLRDVAP